MAFLMYHRDYGILAKCPYCSAVNVVKTDPRQRSCPKIPCKQKLFNEKAREKNARKRAARELLLQK